MSEDGGSRISTLLPSDLAALHCAAEKAVQHNLLFEMLSKATRVAIFNSMAPCSVATGTHIIKQGDEGTKFYILEQGSCDVLIRKDEWGGEPRKVLSYAPGRSGV